MQTMDDATPATQATAIATRRKTLMTVVVLGVCVIAGGVATRSWLYARFEASKLDTAPAKRIPKNAPFIKTPDVVTDRIIELARIGPDDLVYDLGCGDGRLVITAAMTTGCRGVGFDIDPERVAEAKENAKLHDVEELVTIKQQDIFTLDLGEADVVLMYLLPWMNKKLIPQLQQMKPGSRIVSHEFGLGEASDVPPDETIRVLVDADARDSRPVYLWITPLKVPAGVVEE